MYLYPKTLLKGNFLGNIDIAVRKTEVDEKPTESHILFIDNGEAFYATSVSPQNSNGRFKTEFSIGDASKVAIEFDAEWRRNTNGKYRPVTLSEPWLFRVNGTELLAQKGETFNPLVLDTGNITSLKAIRSWQNVLTPEDDHGLVVLYVKDGLPYYINYSYKPEGYKEWSDPQLIPGFSGVTSVTGFRSNDYRLIVLVIAGGIIHQVVSARNWAGIGIPGEQLMSTVDKVEVIFTELQYTNAYGENSSLLQTTIGKIDVDFGTVLTTNRFINASNPDAFTITVDLDEPIFNPDVLSFRIKDGRNRTFRIAEITYNKLKPTLTFHMEDFNNANEGLTIYYTGEGTTTNIKGLLYAPFSINFMPVGLVPVYIPLPVVTTITNVEG